jgi:general secretion pathway protein J
MKSRAVTGFTLIEMVVAVALMSLMALAMFESLRFAQRTYEKINQTVVALAELSSSQRVLRSLIESAYPYANEVGVLGVVRGVPRHLQGGKNEIALSASATMAGGAAGFERYAIVLRRNSVSSNYDVVVRRWVDRNGLSPPSEDAIVEETLVSNVASMDLGYLPAAAAGQVFSDFGATRDPAGPDKWLDEWRERDRLPAAVRVRIKYASKDSRNMTKTGPNIWPGIWPDLVVVPRITDDANCEFDVVAQSCRTGS